MATLKISDLSVGDWVRWKIYDKTYDAQVTGVTDRRIYGLHDGIEYSMLLTQIYPIPITAEILEKNGFESSSSCWTIYKDTGGNIEIWEDEKKWYLSVNSVEYILCDLHWVHQIQHLMRVWGFDKEINL